MASWGDALSFVLPTVPLLAIFGNALVMIAVWKERSLQTVTNLLIVSLAVSDLLVALFVMSFGIYFQMNNFEWHLGQITCNIYLASDVICSTASILNLLAISLDRFMAISHPIIYAQHGMRSSRALVSISIVWGLSVAIGLPILFGYSKQNKGECELSNAYFNIGSSLLSFFIPCAGMIVLYTVIFKRLKQRERARSQRKATKMENERISSALLGGARFASQMGRHFKNRTDQILLEISFQTSSFPTLSESSDEHTSSSLNPLRLTPPLQLPAVTVPVPSPASPPPGGVGEDADEADELLKKSDEDGRKGSDPSTIPVQEEEHPLDADDCSSERIDFGDVYRSFGEHLSELFPFIDSLSRRSSINDEERERTTSPERKEEGRRRKESKRTNRKITLHSDDADNQRPLVDESAKSTPIKRSHSKRNGSLPHRAVTASLQNCSALEEARMPLRLVPIPKSATGLEVPKVHRTVATSSSSPTVNTDNNNHKLSGLEEYSHKTDEDCSKTKSIKKYRDELWKRVTSGWKARPSRQLVKKATKQMRREHKATVTLAVVLAVFLAFWLPFFSLHFANSCCILYKGDAHKHECVPGILLTITTWLGYINSSLNPLIYTVFDQRFRNAFRHIICCSSRRR